MKQRKYSLDEIDRMRAAVQTLGGGFVNVEERLRTYLLNSIEPEELISRALATEQARTEAQRSMDEIRADAAQGLGGLSFVPRGY